MVGFFLSKISIFSAKAASNFHFFQKTFKNTGKDIIPDPNPRSLRMGRSGLTLTINPPLVPDLALNKGGGFKRIWDFRQDFE